MRGEFTEWESDGRFVLSQSPQCVSYDGGSIGSGGGTKLTMFGTAEARLYYKRHLESQETAQHLAHQYEWLVSSLRACLTPSGRVRKKKLAELVGRLPK